MINLLEALIGAASDREDGDSGIKGLEAIALHPLPGGRTDSSPRLAR